MNLEDEAESYIASHEVQILKPKDSHTEIISLFDNDGKKKSQSTLLIEIGSQGLLFHDSNGDAYAECCIDDVMATMLVRSREFREYLSYELYKLITKGANANSITDAVCTLEAKGKFGGIEKLVAIRTFQLNGVIYIDTGCHKRRVIAISKTKWGYTSNAPVKFVRKPRMTELPLLETKASGDMHLLKKYLNISDIDYPLVYGWILCALSGTMPYPILILQGYEGTGKSTASKVIRELVDPSSVPLRPAPKKIKDLLISAGNTHAVVLDNLSGISTETSDSLCRLSTGGGIDVRSLFTNDEQYLINIQKPIIVNGIDDIAARPDLAQRSFIINLSEINEAEFV